MSLIANEDAVDISCLAFPMHGYRKMVEEGFRTRDAHVIEWLPKLMDTGIPEVMSRPNPILLEYLKRRTREQPILVENQLLVHNSPTWQMPNLVDRRRWWVDSSCHYQKPFAGGEVPCLVWNPFVAVSNISGTVFNGRRTVVADLLDDWSVHYAFRSIRAKVEHAYAELFEHADYVTANAEGTADLARRFGRSDVELVPNGVDPQRFDSSSEASGPLTVGYVGKIGKRVDLDLVLAVAGALPTIRFVFAGPILDREYRRPLANCPNVELLGDVHYSEVPELLKRFDLGWVPHRVGDFEVGGDVIKTYEYRAAGLRVLSTPIRGAGDRGLSSVNVLPASEHLPWLRSLALENTRVPRDSSPIPSEHTWRGKVESLCSKLAS